MLTGLIFRRGALFVPALVAKDYFADADGAALLRDGANLLVIPVLRAGAGGCLLKLCSPAGDRVIDARPFFYDNGLGDEPVQVEASWDDVNGRLVVHDIFLGVEPVA